MTKTPLGQAARPYSSPYYFLLFRALLGFYLAVHFFMLVPYAWQLFSSEGMIPRAADLPTYPFFPNVLFVVDSPAFATAFLVALGGLSLLLAVGRFPRLVPLLLWYGWACLVTRNVFIRNPGMPYVGWLLLALPLIPAVIPKGPSVPGQRWAIPRPIFVVAWLLLALGYSISGLHKLQSPSWIEGVALLRLVENPLSRPTLAGDFILSLPPLAIQLGTWLALGLEVSFAFFALFKRTRPWIWLALVGMHLNIMFVVDFIDLTLGMIMIHLFTFDQRWVPAKPAKGPLIVFFDGVCNLCNGFVDGLMREDQGGALKYASLQGETARSVGLKIPDGPNASVVVVEGDRHYGESDAILRIMEALGGVWRVLAIAKVFPKGLRDRAYYLVARNRYTLFGKRESCRLPTPEERALFLP